jgi:hypothetical protein
MDDIPILHRTVKHITLSYTLDLAQAASCITNQHDPFDCHTDIDPPVAHIMGYYQGRETLGHETALEMILDDLTTCLRHLRDAERNSK